MEDWNKTAIDRAYGDRLTVKRLRIVEHNGKNETKCGKTKKSILHIRWAQENYILTDGQRI